MQRTPVHLECKESDTFLFFSKLFLSASKNAWFTNPLLVLLSSCAELKDIFSKQLIYQNTYKKT